MPLGRAVFLQAINCFARVLDQVGQRLRDHRAVNIGHDRLRWQVKFDCNLFLSALLEKHGIAQQLPDVLTAGFRLWHPREF